jgi:uncharacterized protein
MKCMEKAFGQSVAAVVAALLCILLLWVPASGAEGNNAAKQLDEAFSRSTLQIATLDGQLHRFDIWIADNDARRTRGLMFVEQMADDAGMLFIYPRSMPISMWMKNTPLALDILFVRADGRVHHIAENTTPQSEATISSHGNVLAVVELKAGTAARMKIKAGAQVIHPAFKLKN